tara:strand:+ start:11717 stop:13171 length:1455 start_codon:yes stop_codon:yes gene_type:complete
MPKEQSMNPIEAREVVKEYIKRFGEPPVQKKRIKATERSTQFFKDCFEEQIKFINDKSKLKTALCSRRAGKTHSAAVYLLKEALENPDSECAYIALTRINAKRVMWPKLKQLDRQYSMNINFNNSELTAYLPNGSVIYLTGANDQADIDKLRGSAFVLIIIDECASFGPHMDELVEEVLEPTLVDHDGTMCLIGTPNAACTGIFYRATTDPDSDYSNHHWTLLENPHIPHAQDWLDKRMKRRNWDNEHPVYLREWRGRWIRSADSLVYKFNETINLYDSLPVLDYDFEYILGVDLGFNDATAFTICAFNRYLPTLYLVYEMKKVGMIPAEIADHIKHLSNSHKFVRIVMDTGGLGKSIAEEFRIRYNIPVHAASKHDKFSYIELLNSDLRSGFVKVPPDSSIIDEWNLLQWSENQKTEDKRFENHLCDAFLYAWRESKHYCSEELPYSPRYGTKEYWEKVWDEWETEEGQRIEKLKRMEWWEVL